jgi:hypothetical protein
MHQPSLTPPRHPLSVVSHDRVIAVSEPTLGTRPLHAPPISHPHALARSDSLSRHVRPSMSLHASLSLRHPLATRTLHPLMPLAAAHQPSSLLSAPANMHTPRGRCVSAGEPRCIACAQPRSAAPGSSSITARGRRGRRGGRTASPPPSLSSPSAAAR